MTTLMKDSGIDWIGEIPEGWKVKRVKEVAKWKTGFTPSTKIQEYYNGDDEWATISDLDKDLKYIENTKNKINGEYFEGKNKIPKNSLLFSFKLSVGQVAFNKKEMYTNEAICSFLRSSSINLNYFYYAAPVFIIKNANKNIYGANILNQELISNALTLVPPLETQQKITEYLNVEVSKLDKQVSLLERKYELLGDYKDSLIFETVTQGLDKAVSMKDSGIDWIGEIPEEWKVKRLKDVLSFPKLSKAKENSPNYLEIGDVNINTNDYDISNKEKLSVDNAKQAKKGMLVISTVRPARGGITIIKEDCPISSAFCVVNIKGNKYWYYLIKNKLFLNQLSNLNTGVTYPTCKDKDIYNQSSCVPPLETQQKIADYLDVEVEKLDKQRELIKRKVELLKEYKEALIFEVVTGKKEVK